MPYPQNGAHYVRPELYGAPVAPKRKGLRAFVIGSVIAVVLICTGGVIGAVRGIQSVHGSVDTASGAWVEPSTYGPPASTGGPVAAPAGDSFGPDGAYAVGSDIPAGTYATVAPADGLGCYWSRVRSFDGELGSIIANGNLEPGGRGQLVVKPKDHGVTVSGDCVWTRKAVKK